MYIEEFLKSVSEVIRESLSSTNLKSFNKGNTVLRDFEQLSLEFRELPSVILKEDLDYIVDSFLEFLAKYKSFLGENRVSNLLYLLEIQWVLKYIPCNPSGEIVCDSMSILEDKSFLINSKTIIDVFPMTVKDVEYSEKLNSRLFEFFQPIAKIIDFRLGLLSVESISSIILELNIIRDLCLNYATYLYYPLDKGNMNCYFDNVRFDSASKMFADLLYKEVCSRRLDLANKDNSSTTQLGLN